VQHLAIVARSYRIAGLLLGIPSVALLLDTAVNLFLLRDRPALPASQPLDVKTYGLVALLSDGVRGIAAMFSFFGELVVWGMIFLALLAFAVSLFAALLYFTGNGLDRHATWARLCAIAIASGLLLTAIGAAGITSWGGLAAALAAIAAALYALWVLLWRFSPAG
jgi:hypothetical protein